jgi:restriction system protein
VIPTYEQLMLPLLRRLAAGEQHVRALSDALADDFALSTEERAAQLPSGRGVTLIHSRVGWAKTYLKQAGLVVQPRRGWVALTTLGEGVVAAPPERLDAAYLARFPDFAAFLERSRRAEDSEAAAPVVARPSAPPAASPEEQIASATQALRASVAAELLERLAQLHLSRFEALIVDLLHHLGFGGGTASRRGERLGQSGDGGVDGVMREDALGLDVVYIQAKRYAPGRAVSPEAIQAFAGSLLEHGATKGVFVTTSRFTDGARSSARRLSTQRRLVLIDGDELAQLMIEHGVGVRTTQTIRLQRVDLSDYEED